MRKRLAECFVMQPISSVILLYRDRRGHDRKAIGFTSTYALATGPWFPQDTPASSTKKTNLHEIAEILLKPAKHYKPLLLYLQ